MDAQRQTPVFYRSRRRRGRRRRRTPPTWPLSAAKAAARSQQLRNAVFAVRASRATRPREGAGAAWRFRSGEQRTRQVISLRRWLETAGIGDGRVSAGSIATGTSGARYRNRALVAEIAAAAVRLQIT